ncbi:MAG: protein-export chaperone SecB [Verrucomicrobiaceae bacterium]|nr:protein-export chaperone SecB [Verrucomicrobiaceae bacterium]
MTDTDQQVPADQAQQFALQRIYIKDLSFEVPLGAQIFTKQWQPQVQIDLNTKADKIADDVYEAVLTITVTAKIGEDTAFLIEVQQAGAFFVKGVEGEPLRRVLMIMCPTILFPYARETIDSLATRGSFPPLMLQPVNFEALYVQAQQQQQPEAAH